jgi:hypothetical protein
MSRDDEWRTVVELGDPDHHSRFTGALSGRRLAREAKARTGDRVVVTHDGPHVYLYTDSADGAHTVAGVARELLDEEHLNGTVAVARWHPIEQRWEDAAKALPSTPEERDAELARSGDADRARSRRQGFPEWDVRLTLPTREAAAALEAQLASEGIAVVRGGAAMIAGADTEADAEKLAERLRAEAPKGTFVEVEVNRAEAWSEAHPFAFLGGLAN